ncbi:MAG: ATP-binding protein, partial [Ferruginibacter sp.]
KNSINSNYVISVIEVDDDHLGLGLLRGGFDIFDKRTGVFSHHLPEKDNPNSISSSTVTILYRNHDGKIWIGTWGEGLDLYDREKNTFTHYKNDPANKNSIVSNFVSCILEDSKKNLWIGSGDGLERLNERTNQFIHFRHSDNDKKSLSQSAVQFIFEDHTNNLWFGTSAGLNLFNRKNETFTAFTEKDGLANNMIKSILEDRSGMLWLASNNGLTRFNPLTIECRNYTISDGLQGKEFKPSSCYRAADGKMYFGGNNGYNTFYPDSLMDNPFIPPVYITDFQVFNKKVLPGGKNSPLNEEISEAKEITLSYSQSVFSFEFSALSYTLPGKNQYAYKLQGFDKEWIYAGNKRTATYTNLNPRDYVFMVKGTNNDGVWNEEGTAVKITITPPFWLTWWFIMGMFALIVSSVYGFYRMRMNGVQKQKILLEQKVNEQTILLVDLNEEERMARMEAEQARTESEMARHEAYQVNEQLQIKNNQLEQFAYVASHDLQEPLRTTASFVELLQQKYCGKIDEKADKYLVFISEATARMRILIDDLLDFAKIGTSGELKKTDCNVILKNLLADIMAAIQDSKADIQYTDLPVINGYPTEIKLLFQNLVINAMKFQKKGINPLIKISAHEKDGYWQFAVSDNGIGIEKQYSERIFDIFQRLHTRQEYTGSGIGLSHCKKIVELHRGKIWVESTPGNGSTFYFSLPTAVAGYERENRTALKTY